MGPNERRTAIIRVLCLRRRETMRNLAAEFGVSIRTIKYDIDILSLEYPIITIKGNNGGVELIESYHYGQRYLNPQQEKLLYKLLATLSGTDRDILQSVLNEFALNKWNVP